MVEAWPTLAIGDMCPSGQLRKIATAMGRKPKKKGELVELRTCVSAPKGVHRTWVYDLGNDLGVCTNRVPNWVFVQKKVVAG